MGRKCGEGEEGGHCTEVLLSYCVILPVAELHILQGQIISICYNCSTTCKATYDWVPCARAPPTCTSWDETKRILQVVLAMKSARRPHEPAQRSSPTTTSLPITSLTPQKRAGGRLFRGSHCTPCCLSPDE
jgi:hypothetical protein